MKVGDVVWQVVGKHDKRPCIVLRLVPPGNVLFATGTHVAPKDPSSRGYPDPPEEPIDPVSPIGRVLGLSAPTWFAKTEFGKLVEKPRPEPCPRMLLNKLSKRFGAP